MGKIVLEVEDSMTAFILEMASIPTSHSMVFISLPQAVANQKLSFRFEAHLTLYLLY